MPKCCGKKGATEVAGCVAPRRGHAGALVRLEASEGRGWNGCAIAQVPAVERVLFHGSQADKRVASRLPRHDCAPANRSSLPPIFPTVLREPEAQEYPQSPKWPSTDMS